MNKEEENKNEKAKLSYNKTYIIKKDEDINDILDVKEYFEQADKFLNINPKISIRLLSKKSNKSNIQEIKILPEIEKTQKGPKSKRKSRYSFSPLYLKKEKEENNINLSPYKRDKSKNNDLKMQIPLTTNKSRLLTERNNHKDNILDHIHYKYRSFKDLKKIMIDSIEREKNSTKKGTNDLIPLKTDINIKEKFFSQGKKLNFNSLSKSNSEKYNKLLAQKCKKKENDLLINNIPNFRIKKQIKDYVENNKILAEKFGDNYWLFSLRRATKNDFTRFNNFNIGTNEREIWKSFTDYPDKEVELINFPYRKGKNAAPLYTEIYKGKIPDINEYENLKIEGKNLAKNEYDNIINAYNTHSNKIIFKLYKDPKENDKNYIKDLIYKEIYLTNQRKDNKETKKIKIKKTINDLLKSTSFNKAHSIEKVKK